MKRTPKEEERPLQHSLRNQTMEEVFCGCLVGVKFRGIWNADDLFSSDLSTAQRHTDRHKYTHTYTYTPLHTLTQSLTYTNAPTHTYTHIHTYIHNRA